MIYGFFALALITSIISIFLFYDFRSNRKYIFADVFMQDFEVTQKSIIEHFDESELIIDLFERRWQGHISKRTLKTYIGKLIETQQIYYL